ncbi:hypothetical protein N658DRAFT_417010 [Parathielavia hyrcaniae]|uniref:2EXR domain-containing protein n=1 Tax=Parathielavia hyrcaniae TaxID=113614 RepID=A0AAN6T6D3_9PEZI|nr:hypothetical protein N658DRAFT_417010 [Parathielavia hyrcaniae]
MHYDPRFPRRCASQAADCFPRFQRLPPEIRNMIWELALPGSRVYEVLDAPNSKQKTPAQEGLMFANVHPEPPPALAAVCRESRSLVLHHYKRLTLGKTTKYVDMSRDILLLEPYLLVKRLHRALHFMSQIPLVRDNAAQLALGTSYGIYPGIFHPVLGRKVSKNNMGKLLASLAKFPRLRTLIFVVHQEFQFQFDFHFPGTLTPMLPGPAAPTPGFGLAPGPRPTTAVGYSSTPSQAHAINTPHPTPAPSSVPDAAQTQTQAQNNRPQQQVHQAYRFKFDIESNINSPPRRPHTNELLYYPLDVRAVGGDDEFDEYERYDGEGGEWCDPWPTNDDWKRFRRRWVRGMLAACSPHPCGASSADGNRGDGVEAASRGLTGGKGCGSWAGKGGKGKGAGARVVCLPRWRLKGVSLLWRYTRGVGGAQ